MSWLNSFVGRFSGDPHWPVLGDPRGSRTRSEKNKTAADLATTKISVEEYRMKAIDNVGPNYLKIRDETQLLRSTLSSSTIPADAPRIVPTRYDVLPNHPSFHGVFLSNDGEQPALDISNSIIYYRRTCWMESTFQKRFIDWLRGKRILRE